eukprot:637639-Amorphochlora_amoeboformis.AAC.2
MKRGIGGLGGNSSNLRADAEGITSSVGHEVFGCPKYHTYAGSHTIWKTSVSIVRIFGHGCNGWEGPPGLEGGLRAQKQRAGADNRPSLSVIPP